MAYHELIKNFNIIREYMRSFYVYGFSSREEYDKKSGRTYDDAKRRIESYLFDYIQYRQDSEGKRVFISVDTRSTVHNPLYQAFKAKSFTDGDITIFFIVFDILYDTSVRLPLGDIVEIIDRDYLSFFDEPKTFDVSTIRKKLNEFVSIGLLQTEKQGKIRLSDMLNHLYVLVPVFDKKKHYYMSEDEIDKLLRHGEGWLSDHPKKNTIIRRYFDMKRSYANKTIARLLEAESEIEETEQSDVTTEIPEPEEKRIPLNTQRMEAVKNAVLASGAVSVLDIGCGEGKLTSILLRETQIKRITAADVSVSVLEKAKQKLNFDRMQPYLKDKLTLIQASLMYKDKRLESFDAACVVEVIEHMDEGRIPLFEKVLFGGAKPKTVIVTTPNKEYNDNYPTLENGTLRHKDHRFEWTREEFRNWCRHICKEFGYAVKYQNIGDTDEKCGSPTQMGVFTICV